MAVVSQSSVKFGKKRVLLVGATNFMTLPPKSQLLSSFFFFFFLPWLAIITLTSLIGLGHDMSVCVIIIIGMT